MEAARFTEASSWEVSTSWSPSFPRFQPPLLPEWARHCAEAAALIELLNIRATFKYKELKSYQLCSPSKLSGHPAYTEVLAGY